MAAIPNPYNPLQPTENPNYFFGRDEAFAFFRQNLVGAAHKHALVLIGRRGLGKSSLLRQLSYQLEDRYCLCTVNLSGLELTGEEVFFAALVDEIHQALDRAEVSTYRLPDWPETAEGQESPGLRDWFNTTFLDIALTALRVRHLLILFDDAHLLLQAIDRGALSPDLLDYLLVIQTQHLRLDMAFALDEAFEDRVLAIELFRDPALHYRLTELSAEAAERLIREPVREVFRYESGVVEQILALSDGHPFLLHSICRLLFRRSEERHHAGPVIENDLTAVYDAALEQAGEILSPLWQSATQNERLILTGLVQLSDETPGESIRFDALYRWIAATGYVMNKTQLAAGLRSLDYKGLVRTDSEGRYVLPALLIPRWIKANTAVEIEKRPSTRPGTTRWVTLAGLLAALLIVGGLGIAALAGAFDGGDDSAPVEPGTPTATLSLNYGATQQADYKTQTEIARPTATPTRTPTFNLTATQRALDRTAEAATASQQTLDAALSATPLPTRTPTRTPRPTVTTPPPPTNTPRRTPTATLDPGG